MSKINSISLKKEVLNLYKKILTLHYKKFNEEMRFFGDFFVKSEFRLNYLNSNDSQIKMFLSQWNKYHEDLIITPVKEIKPDEGLKTRMDIDQMKSLNQIQTLIDDNAVKKKN
jgi:hypothetical protein